MADEKKPAAAAPQKKGKPLQLYKLFEKKGESVSRKNKFCPKCGQGYIMAQHKDRVNCGKCGYTEWNRK